MLSIARAVIITTTVMSEVENHRRFRELCKSLPQEEAYILIKADRKKREEEEKHRKALEIANAGRARNFWGL